MRIGVTGHQNRSGIDWPWVKATVRVELSKIADVERVISSLAAGSDQIFTEIAISLGIKATAIIPLPGYERYFAGKALLEYRRLLRRCEIIQLPWRGDEQRSFLEAGKRVVTESNLVFAIWDGEGAEGTGGTGDIVEFARSKGRPIIQLNPIKRSVARL